MAFPPVHAGSTSVTVEVFVQDSSSTVGAGLAGLTSSSVGLTGYYSRQRTGSTSFAFASLGSATAGWTSGGIFQIDSVGMKGFYRLDLPDACFASGSPFVTINLAGATNMAQCPVLIPITAVDPQDSVRFGMTALPNAAAAASGGLIINGANAGSGSASMTWNGDIGGRVLGVTTTSFSGVGVQADVEQWKAGTVPAPNVTGVPIVDLKYTSGTQVFNFDGTFAGGSSGSVTFPVTDSAGNAVPDDVRYEYSVFELVTGTGAGQLLFTATKTGTRIFATVGAWTPVAPANDTTYLRIGSWRANATHLGGTLQTGRDVGLSVLLSSGTGTGQILLSSGKVSALLSSTDVTGNLAADLQTIKTQTVTAAGAVTFPAGATLASTTNITAGTITTVAAVTVVNGLANNVITAASIAADADAEIAGAVWDVTLSGHLTSGTTGAALNAAGSAGDPWQTAIPGTYGAGTAGAIVGTLLDAAVSTRSTLTAAQVWASGTRTLTSGAGIVLAKGVGITGFNDVSASDILYTALTETYATAGSTFTLAQGLYEICQGITQFAIASTLVTVQKRDRSTTATTYTLDAAPPNATSRTRAS